MISVTDNSPTHNEYSNETEENSTPQETRETHPKSWSSQKWMKICPQEWTIKCSQEWMQRRLSGRTRHRIHHDTQMHDLTVTEMISVQIDVDPKLVKNTLKT